MTKSVSVRLQQTLLTILIIETVFTKHIVLRNTHNQWNYNKFPINSTYHTVPAHVSPQSCEENDNSIESSKIVCTNSLMEDGILYRLPNTTYPIHYSLHITTNIHRGIFEYKGNITIEIKVLQNTNEIIINAHNLNIFKILLEDLTAKTKFKNLSFIAKNHILKIFCTENDDEPTSTEKVFMRNHRLRLEIHYSSVISTANMGFYQMTYMNKEGDIVIGAATQFEPIFARSALPCYDEPAYKSRFLVRITHGTNYTAISNMPDDGNPVSSHSNMTTTTFLETPPMSVYLLAFVISNFKNVSKKAENVLQRVLLPKDSNFVNINSFLQNAIFVTNAFEDLVGVSYFLPKLDHVIVNESYGKGMENWGLITYRSETFLNRSYVNQKIDFDIWVVQAHELVHQWFGNLVTPEWWTYVWLSEGFATYYGYLLMDKLAPEHMALQYYQSLICSEYRAEFDDTTMTPVVDTPLSIINSFSTAVYLKAGCVIQMFEHAFGQQVFRNGLSRYLKSHALSTVNEKDLFDALQTEIVQDQDSQFRHLNYSVHEIMYSWTHSRTYPIIEVSRNYGNQSTLIHLKQKASDDQINELFWVPLNFVTSKSESFENTIADFYMPPVDELIVDMRTLNLSLEPDDWLILNKRGTGFFCVVYDSRNWRFLSEALKRNHTSIHPQSRISLFYDLSNPLGYERQIKTTEDFIIRLECVKYLKHESNPFVWIAAVPLMSTLIENLKNDETAYQLIREFVLKISMPIYERLGNKTAAYLSVGESNLIEDLENFLCLLEVKSCLLLRKSFVLKFILGEHTNMNDTILKLCSAAEVFNEQEFDLALDFFVGQRKLKMWAGLGCTRNDSWYERFLEKVLDMSEDSEYCEDNLLAFIDILTQKKLSERVSTWVIFKRHISRIIEFSPCVDSFFENLTDNLGYIEDPHTEELRFFYEKYAKFKGIDSTFNETVVGKNIRKKVSNLALIVNVVKWLKIELLSGVNKTIS